MVFAKIRCALDVLRNRLPGASAMLKADDISIMVNHNSKGSKVEITFWFDKDGAAAGNATRAFERLYRLRREEE